MGVALGVYLRFPALQENPCKVVMRAVNHFLLTMAGINLAKFLPEKALKLGSELREAELLPVYQRFILCSASRLKSKCIMWYVFCLYDKNASIPNSWKPRFMGIFATPIKSPPLQEIVL